MVTRAQMKKIFTKIQPHFVLTNDADGYAGLFTRDAVWWPLGRSTRTGPRQIREGVAQVLQGSRTVPVFKPMQLLESDPVSTAVLFGTETITQDNGGPTQVVHSREIWMFREEDGQPKICRMIWNEDPAVAPRGAPSRRAAKKSVSRKRAKRAR